MTDSAESVVTLVAGLGTVLTSDRVRAVADRLGILGAGGIHVHSLVEGRVEDVFFFGLSLAEVRRELGHALEGEPMDFFVQPGEGRTKKLLIADMESTIIEQEMLDELADLIGVRARVADITRRAMNGELDFASALRERVGLLKGVSATLVEEMTQRITLMPGAEALITTMKAKGAVCWLVSGGFTCFVEPVARRLGFDASFANQLLVRDGVITGEVADPILDKNSKKSYLEQAVRQLGITLAETTTVGDGANDIPMLTTSNEGGGLGIAFHAKPTVRAVVPHQINFSDLTSILYAQGLVPKKN